MEQLLNSYYENSAKKLHTVVNRIFQKKYGGIAGRDIEEFYGIGTDVLTDIWNKYRLGKSTYNPLKGDFDAYVYRAISMAIIDEFKKQNRDKRSSKIEIFDEQGNKKKISINDIRLDAPLSNDSSITYGDMIQSDFKVEEDNENDIRSDDRVQRFLELLPNIQRKIIEMKICEYSVEEIKEKLNLSDAEYNKHIRAIEINENL